MDVTLTATTGRTTGSRPSKRLRAEGQIPGTLYGLGKDPITVGLDRRSLRHALSTDAGLNAVITLDVDGSDELCIVKELQRHPVRNDVIHVDFVRVDANIEIEVEVPIVLEGEPKAVLDEQGVVDQIHYTLSVYAKPNAIPNEIIVDISGLSIGHTITVGDITLPAGARTEVDPEDTIVTASVTRAEPVEGEVAEDTTAEASAADDGDAAADSADDADEASSDGDADES